MITVEGRMGDWVEELCKLFEKEIGIYSRLWEGEMLKRSAIQQADGKALQEQAKNTYHLMVEASELERLRMQSIESVYQNSHLPKSEEGITLSDFLNKIDRDSNFKLKGYATELKTVVHKLKDAVIVNEKLILTRQELLHKTVQELQRANTEPTYSPHSHRSKSKIQSGSKPRAMVLNTSA